MDELYDFADRDARTVTVEYLCNQMIHSYVFALLFDEASLYQLLQVVSITVFEKTPILRAFERTASKVVIPPPAKQLTLLDL